MVEALLRIWDLKWDPHGGRLQGYTCRVQTCATDYLCPKAEKSQRECDFMRELSGMAGSSKLKKKKCCGAMGTMEGLQLEREYFVKAPWAHMYFPEGKMGNVQYNILATSTPSASQIQARPHHMVFGNYTGRVQRS